ncbi:MAG: hypothetical protein GY906_23035 [bacterium]|nr:hypothetical protein [bacterium]
MRALIDGDILVHRSIAVATTKITVDHTTPEGVFEVDLGTSIKAISRQHAQDEVYRLVDEWCKKSGSKGEPLIALSDRRRPDSTFRYSIFPAYKANRGGGEKASQWWDIHHMIEKEFDSLWYQGLEGDDVIGIQMTRYPKTFISISNDKDMRTIPGRHYNTQHDKVLDVSSGAADWYWMWQTLIGDKTDNYPGCPGVGPKRAAEFIGSLADPRDYLTLSTLWKKVLEAYHEFSHETRWADLWPDNLSVEEFAIQQARCARILRQYDYKRQTVRLWHPNAEYDFLNFSTTAE